MYNYSVFFPYNVGVIISNFEVVDFDRLFEYFMPYLFENNTLADDLAEKYRARASLRRLTRIIHGQTQNVKALRKCSFRVRAFVPK